jgi:spermidine synthase
MMALDDDNWFTEVYPDDGSAFSLRITETLHEETTPYQSLAVYQTEHFGRLMTLDGCVMLTGRDNFIYHEMMTHAAICSHPAPARILIIGGGDCGCLKECLKHPDIDHVHQVDLDERVTRASERWFPELCSSNDDPRAAFSFTDGVAFAEQAEPCSYDIVIIDSVDPVGQAARLYSVDFYRACMAALTDQGIMIAQSESPLFHAGLIGSMRQRMADAGFDSTETLHFPQCSYPSGWWSATMAHKSSAEKNIRHVGLETGYYNYDIHRAALAVPQFMRGVY